MHALNLRTSGGWNPTHSGANPIHNKARGRLLAFIGPDGKQASDLSSCWTTPSFSVCRRFGDPSEIALRYGLLDNNRNKHSSLKCFSRHIADNDQSTAKHLPWQNLKEVPANLSE